MFGGQQLELRTMQGASLHFVSAAFGLLGCIACDPLCVARGKLVDVDGLTGARCAVKLHHRAGEPEKYGLSCRQPNAVEGDSDRWVVKVGQEFQCSTIPGSKGRDLDLSVTCEGYEPFRGSSFEWKVEGFTCRSHDFGMIRLHRASKEPGKTQEE